MEEADQLSDRIVVIVNGELKCIGTPLYLKNFYGDGYRLSLISENQHLEFLKEFIKDKFPSSKIIDESGGSIIVSIPLIKIDELNIFFKFIF